MRHSILVAVTALIFTPVFAADMPTKAPLVSGYPVGCGFFYGLGTGGNAGAVKGAAVGTQIVQGDINALVGYTCPFATDAFWFVEGSFGFANLNGDTNGFSLSGPMVAIQRFGVGSPVNAIFNPFGNSLSLPSLPVLPVGVTVAGTAKPYVFGAIVEQDIGAQIFDANGVQLKSHQWVVAPMLGAGLLSRLSNGVVADTWAGWQMNSNSFCPGGGNICGKLGNMVRVGVSLKY